MTWDAGLKHTGVTLELLQDVPSQKDMYLFFEAAIRGGISTVTKRRAVANNQHLPESYNPDEPSTYLAYMDANNLVNTPDYISIR